MRQIYERAMPHWRASLVAISFGVLLIQIGRAFFDFTGLSVTAEALPLVNIDAATYQHAGWWMTQGAIPYIDIWEIKPPLAWYTPAMLALLSGSDMLLLHLMSVVVTCAAMLGIVYLVGTLTFDMTASPLGGLAGGLVMLALPGFPYLGTLGFRPKYFMLLLGLTAILLQRRGRPIWSGISAAAATGYVLQGAVFPALVLFMGFQARRPASVLKTLAGMALLTTLALIPILVWGATLPMFVEVVIAPLVSSEAQSAMLRMAKFLRHTKHALPLSILGLYGMLRFSWQERGGRSWVALGGLAFAGQVIFLDFDSFPDLFGLHCFVSLGAGLVVAEGGIITRRLLMGILAPILILNSVWLGGLGVIFEEASPPAQEPTQSVEVRMGLPNMAYIYWNKVRPESCHYRLGTIEKQWLKTTGQPLSQRRCETHWGSHLGDLLRLKSTPVGGPGPQRIPGE